MTSLTLTQVRDATLETVFDAWTAVGAVTENIPLRFDNTPGDKPDSPATAGIADPWARATFRVAAQPQETIGARRRYDSQGFVVVQVFTAIGDGHTLGDACAQVVVDALRAHDSSTDGVTFYDARVGEIGADGPWFQTNVTVAVRWQEIA